MVVTIVGLVLVQIRYVRINAEMIENQFKENVQRSLFQAVRLVEENEALQYLSETLEDADYSAKSNRIIKSGTAQRNALGMTSDSMVMDSGKDFTLNQKLPSIQLSTKHGKATIEETSRYLQKKFQQDFSRSKTILDQAVFRWLRESDQKEISQRVNFDELNDILQTLLENNGVTLPFNYSVVDKQGRLVYKHTNITVNEQKNVANRQCIYTKTFPF